MATSFVSTAARGDNWQAVVDECLENLRPGTSGSALGFVYISDALAPHLADMVTELQRRTGIADWCGTVAAGLCHTATEIYDEPAAVLLIANLPDDSYRLLPAGLAELETTLADNRDWIEGEMAHFGVIHGDPRSGQTPQLIATLAHELNPGFLVGGLSSASADDNQRQVAGAVCEGGISGVLMSSRVAVVTGLTQGCSPIGPKHTVTRADRNILIELNGRPALDVFKEDIGEVLARDLSRVGGYIFAGLPIPGSDTADYLVRNLVGIDPQQGMVAIGDMIEEGDSVLFCRRDPETARADMTRMLDDLAKRSGGRPKAGLYYSCLGRGRYQFGDNSEELTMIRDQLGDFPLAGFFANGEIFHDRLYGYTGVLTLFL